jgi:hypothetical protein
MADVFKCSVAAHILNFGDGLGFPTPCHIITMRIARPMMLDLHRSYRPLRVLQCAPWAHNSTAAGFDTICRSKITTARCIPRFFPSHRFLAPFPLQPILHMLHAPCSFWSICDSTMTGVIWRRWQATIGRFNDGECNIQLGENVRNAHVFVIQARTHICTCAVNMRPCTFTQSAICACAAARVVDFAHLMCNYSGVHSRAHELVFPVCMCAHTSVHFYCYWVYVCAYYSAFLLSLCAFTITVCVCIHTHALACYYCVCTHALAC